MKINLIQPIFYNVSESNRIKSLCCKLTHIECITNIDGIFIMNEYSNQVDQQYWMKSTYYCIIVPMTMLKLLLKNSVLILIDPQIYQMRNTLKTAETSVNLVQNAVCSDGFIISHICRGILCFWSDSKQE